MKLNQDFINAFEDGVANMVTETAIKETHWYPCGFAWLAVKIRKNGALANTLKSLGFRWDDYRKHYYYSMPHEYVKFSEMSQSMNYRERCLNALAKTLNANGFPCYVETRID